MTASPLRLDGETRRALWTRVADEIEGYLTGVGGLPVRPGRDEDEMLRRLGEIDFARPLAADEAVGFVADGLRRWQMQCGHPRYFGLFNPPSTTMGIAADALAAGFNMQVGAWHHSPLGVAIERRLVRELGARFGFGPAVVDGTFTSGGNEANHTAVIAALASVFPAFREGGVRALDGNPVLYVSAEAHHSFVKAARACGLGDRAVRRVPVDAALRMQPAALERMIAADRAAGDLPFLAVATVGTTNAGAIDPLHAVAEVAERAGVWLHVDAAWGGAAALVPALAPLLDGTARADSLTFDAHKWLSVPMGAGLFLTRRPGALTAAFHLETAYVPRGEESLERPDYYVRSLQWSRRAIGLKLFLTLAVAGWEGYAAALGHQVAMGELLRGELRASGWAVVNDTPLPIVCFTAGRPAENGGEADAERLDAVAAHVVAGGRAWLSTTRLTGIGPVLRACITSFETEPEDVRMLVAALDDARRAVG
ncbi:MAG TPA: aminotransferase class V-fold PLP-dependent enzyme [Longimicrobium sp.]|nr:aminotransferase class V-fold PLP-dependent enzyme [Longimicrobium sp.]